MERWTPTQSLRSSTKGLMFSASQHKLRQVVALHVVVNVFGTKSMM